MTSTYVNDWFAVIKFYSVFLGFILFSPTLFCFITDAASLVYTSSAFSVKTILLKSVEL